MIIVFGAIFCFLANKFHLISPNNCGIASVKRIVGGTEAIENEFPWVVSVQRKYEYTLNGMQWDEWKHYCGGVIVTERHVLSAAHCFKEVITQNSDQGGRRKVVATLEYAVLYGTNNGSTSRANYRHHLALVTQIIRHEKHYSRYQRNDVAIAKLDRNLPINSTNSITVNTICFPTKEDVSGVATVAGWGRIDRNVKRNSFRLQKVTIPIIDWTDCNRLWLRYDWGLLGKVLVLKSIGNNNICAIGTEVPRQGAAKGDSGSPLFQYKKGRAYLIGIDSFGPKKDDERAISLNLPGVFTKIWPYLDWIKKRLN